MPTDTAVTRARDAANTSPNADSHNLHYGNSAYGGDGRDVFTKRRNRRMLVFIDCLKKGLSIAGAAKHAHVNKSQLYIWRTKYPSFDDAWSNGLDEGCDFLEDVIRGHSLKDWRAAESLLKARRPEKWRERYVNDQSTTNVNVLIAEAEGASVALKNRIDGIARRLREGKVALTNVRGGELPDDARLDIVGTPRAIGTSR